MDFIFPQSHPSRTKRRQFEFIQIRDSEPGGCRLGFYGVMEANGSMRSFMKGKNIWIKPLFFNFFLILSMYFFFKERF